MIDATSRCHSIELLRGAVAVAAARRCFCPSVYECERLCVREETQQDRQTEAEAGSYDCITRNAIIDATQTLQSIHGGAAAVVPADDLRIAFQRDYCRSAALRHATPRHATPA